VYEFLGKSVEPIFLKVHISVFLKKHGINQNFVTFANFLPISAQNLIFYVKQAGNY